LSINSLSLFLYFSFSKSQNNKFDEQQRISVQSLRILESNNEKIFEKKIKFLIVKSKSDMKQLFLTFVVCTALIASGADGSPGKFGRGGGFRSGGGSRGGGSRSWGGSSSKTSSSGSGSKSSGWFSGWFSSSKPSAVSSNIQPKASAPSLSSFDSGPKPIGWNLNNRGSPVGPPPAYPGLEKVPIGSSPNAPPLYSLNKPPPPYNSINHLNTGVSSGTHLGPPPAYTPGFGQPVPGIAAQPPITVINNYPAHSSGSSHGGNLGSNMLFFGLGSLSSRGSSSSVHHVYHDTNTNSAGRSFVEPEQTTTATVVPLAPFPGTEPVPTSTFEPILNSNPNEIYTANRPPMFVNPELPSQSTEPPVMNVSTLISTLAGKPDVSVIPIIEPSRHISTSYPLSATTETPNMVMNTTMRSSDLSEKLVKFALDLYFMQFLRNQPNVDLEPAMEAKKDDFAP
jgi:hypothetical protein